MSKHPQRLAFATAVASSVAIALFVNVLSARHFARWDKTSDRRWSLSPATEATLRDLPEPVTAWVLLSPGDPTFTSVKELLSSYRAVGGERFRVTYIDPDREGIAYADVRRRFSMDDGRTEEGRVVADAPIVVSTASRHWFVAAEDLVAVTEGAAGLVARPREERALTSALRSVLSGKKVTVCFTTGHGEPPLDGASEGEGRAAEHEGLGFFRELLTKDNYEVRALAPHPSPAQLSECGVVVVPTIRTPFETKDADALGVWALHGRLLVALPPLPSADPASTTGLAAPNLDAVFAPFGIVPQENMVFEGDPAKMLADTGAAGFSVEPLLHPITRGLVGARPGQTAPDVFVHGARTFRTRAPNLGFTTTPLLQTSPLAYATSELAGAATWTGPPSKKASDATGPLVVAYAAEGPAHLPNGNSERQPRLVVYGGANLFSEASFRADPTSRGTAFLLGGALSWLAEREVVLDIPEKPAVAAGVHMREDDLTRTFRTVVLYLPASILVLFAAVFFFRRAGDHPGSREPSPSPVEAEAPRNRAKRTKRK